MSGTTRNPAPTFYAPGPCPIPRQPLTSVSLWTASRASKLTAVSMAAGSLADWPRSDKKQDQQGHGAAHESTIRHASGNNRSANRIAADAARGKCHDRGERCTHRPGDRRIALDGVALGNETTRIGGPRKRGAAHRILFGKSA